MTLSHLTLNTGRLATTTRAEAADVAVEECRTLLKTGGGLLPGDLRAFRVEDLQVTPGEIATFFLARGREKLVWVIICATEFAAEPLWQHVGPLTRAARPPVPWVCVQLLEGLQAQTPDDMSWMGDFERCAAWAALELFSSPEE